MSPSNGRTLKLFLVDGMPNGLLTAEIMNWTGHVITGPRSRLGELIQRPESRPLGCTFWSAQSEDQASEPRSTLARPTMSRSGSRPTTGPKIPVADEPSPLFVGDVPRHGITARGQEINGEFVVLKGSKTRIAWEGVDATYTGLFNELVRTGILVPTADGRHREFTRDYAFSSPSAAAAIVAERSANGRPHWIDEKSRLTYGAWQEARVNQALERQAPGDPLLEE